MTTNLIFLFIKEADIPTSKNKKTEGLTIGQRNAVLKIVSGMKQKQVAKELKVTPETIRLWRMKEEFRIYLEKTLRTIELDAINHLRALSRKAIDTLSDLLGPDSPPEIRFKTAHSVLEMTAFHNVVPKTRQDKYIEEVEKIEKKVDKISSIDLMLD